MDNSGPLIPAPKAPPQAPPLVAALLILTAAIGGVFGYTHVTPLPGGSTLTSASTARAAVSAARLAIPIPDAVPAAATPDEAFIRRIAREEAQAALHPRHAAPTLDANLEGEIDPDEDPTVTSARNVVAPPAAASIPQPQNLVQPSPR
jgi:hypothetical protein